jgi:hypothetical protein
MVKTMKPISAFLLLVALSLNGALADESPSPASLKGKEITPEVIRTLPRRDCSTPQKAFLGLLRSDLEGNIRDHLFYLTPDAKKATAGVTDESEVPEEKARAIAEALKKDDFQGVRLESYQASPDVYPTQIVAVVASSRGKTDMREKYNIRVVQTNGLWKFSSVCVDMIDHNPSDR